MMLYEIRSLQGIRDGSLLEPKVSLDDFPTLLAKAGIPDVPNWPWPFLPVFFLEVPRDAQAVIIEFWLRRAITQYGLTYDSAIVYAHEAIREAARDVAKYRFLLFVVVAAALKEVDLILEWYGHTTVDETSVAHRYFMECDGYLWFADYYSFSRGPLWQWRRKADIGFKLAGHIKNPDWVQGGLDDFNFLGTWREIFHRLLVWHVYHWKTARVQFLGCCTRVSEDIYQLQEGYVEKLGLRR